MNITIVEGCKSIEVIIKCPEATDDIRKMEHLLNINAKRISCIKDGATYLISISDVLYFETVDKRSFLYTEKDVYELSLRLYAIDEMVSDMGFIRSSKSQVLNINKISRLCPDFSGRIEATMENGERLIISRQYAKSLKERLRI